MLEESPFFKNAVKPAWAAARGDHPIDLTDENPDIADVYFSWLYSRILRVSEKWESLKYAQLYVFGEKLMHCEFQNDVINAMIRYFVGMDTRKDSGSVNITIIPGARAITTIYEGTIQGSPARRLMVDRWCEGHPFREVEQYRNHIPHDFAWDYLKAFLSSNPIQHKSFADPSLYHIEEAEKDRQA